MPAELLWQLNADADRPDLTVILTGSAELCRARARARGIYSRFHDSTAESPQHYLDVADQLVAAGHHVLIHDITNSTAEQVVDALFDTVLRLPDSQAGRRDIT